MSNLALVEKNTSSDLALNYMKDLDSSYNEALGHFFKHLDNNDLSLNELSIENYYIWLRDQSGNSHATIKIKRSAVKYAINNVLDMTEIFSTEEYVKIKRLLERLDKKIPVKSKQKTAVSHEKIITDQELDILMDNTRDTILRPFIFFLHSTGMRIGETCSIKLSDCIVKGNYVSIDVIGKGDKPRTVTCPIEPFNYAKDYFKGSVYLFEHNSKIYDKRYITTRLSVIGKRVLGKNVHAHMFRHTYISKNIDGGLLPKRIADNVGHSSTAITDLYTHLTTSVDEIKDAMKFKDYSLYEIK